MSKQSYSEMLERVKSLQAEAEEVRRQEIGPVIEKIKEAVAIYRLSPEDIFGKGVSSAPVKSKAAEQRKGYRLGDNYWAGMGKRPNWLRAALAAGKTLDDLRI